MSTNQGFREHELTEYCIIKAVFLVGTTSQVYAKLQSTHDQEYLSVIGPKNTRTTSFFSGWQECSSHANAK